MDGADLQLTIVAMAALIANGALRPIPLKQWTPAAAITMALERSRVQRAW